MTANSKPSSTPDRIVIAVSLIIGLLLASCSSTPVGDEVVGVVSQVTGTDVVETFVVVDADGRSHAFVTTPGLTVDGEPLGQLREYLITRNRIAVTFESTGSGPPRATAIVLVGG